MPRLTKDINTETLQRLLQGDRKAFEAVYHRYGGQVFHFFLGMIHDRSAAEDLTQDVFLKIWEKHGVIDPNGHFEAYLFTIARHLLIKESEKRLQNECLKDALRERSIEADNSMEMEIEAESLRVHIHNYIDQLPPVGKQVFLLSCVHHISHKEIAQRLSIAEKTVETHLYRARQFLRSKLAPER
jgi:RNA polymerase sigma-70 factor (ECF subfamily)